MTSMFRALSLVFILIFNIALTDDALPSAENLVFTPPTGWRNADKAALPQQVHLMIVGKGAHEFPPSITLASEPYQGSVKDYLKVVKKLSISKGNQWKDLGNIRTEAGNASLSQTDSQSQWGGVKMMHVILKKDDTMYILTAAALKEEFPTFYKEIFASLRSVKFSEKSK
jgi:hypothetical protein